MRGGDGMAYEFYVTIQGTKQGVFKGESPGVDEREGPAGQKDKIAGIRFFSETTLPFETASGMASGKRQHKPILLTKKWGAASPQLFQALVTNEVLTNVLFEFLQTDQQGQEFVYHTIKLTNARISGIKSYLDLTDATGDPYDANELEDVSFVYQKLETENKLGKTIAVDTWSP
jgi:type VI secretion system secreted protein Hcp